ncbi:hypothetical protein GY45DRAFT_836445 [Cubamyces sp. BRFM 1775]|nr:hypothetical protein GY45DRAFT_836445 [Cubamyces sp. BRFM 1775]
MAGETGRNAHPYIPLWSVKRSSNAALNVCRPLQTLSSRRQTQHPGIAEIDTIQDTCTPTLRLPVSWSTAIVTQHYGTPRIFACPWPSSRRASSGHIGNKPLHDSVNFNIVLLARAADHRQTPDRCSRSSQGAFCGPFAMFASGLGGSTPSTGCSPTSYSIVRLSG